MQIKQNTMIRRIVDVCMTVLLLFLMAYQVTGEGLSVHYSGGLSLSDDILKWLDTNGINR